MTKFGPFGRHVELTELTYDFPYPYFVQFALYMFSKFIEDPDRIVSELGNTAGERLRWARCSVLAFGTQVRGFAPGRSRRIFRAKKFLARFPSEGK